MFTIGFSLDFTASRSQAYGKHHFFFNNFNGAFELFSLLSSINTEFELCIIFYVKNRLLNFN